MPRVSELRIQIPNICVGPMLEAVISMPGSGQVELAQQAVEDREELAKANAVEPLQAGLCAVFQPLQYRRLGF